MFYPKRLSPEALTEAEQRKISPEQLDELKQHIEGLDYLVLDSPYDTFDLMTNPVMMKKLNAIAGTPIAKKLFGSEEKAKDRILNILRHFNEEGSREFLGITIPFRDFKPIATYAGSKLAEEVPTLLLHGEHDEDTLPIAQENIRNAGIIKQGEFVALNAGHSEQSLQDPGKPASAKRYFQMLRDPQTYLGKLGEFLVNNEAVDPQLLEDEKVVEKLKAPNRSALLAT